MFQGVAQCVAMCFNELQRVLQGYCSKAVTCRNSTRNASRCAVVAVCCDELQCVTECDRDTVQRVLRGGMHRDALLQ